MPKATSKPFARMLLTTDGSPSAQQATEVAAKIAKSFESDVTVLSALPSLGGTAAPKGKIYSEMMSRADSNVAEAASVFKKAGVTVSEKEVPRGRGSVVETIVEQAAKEATSLIVMGTRGLGGLKRVVLGSVSSGVAEHASSSTLVVRTGKRGGGGIARILVAIDGSANAQRALEVAADLAHGLGAELRIAHVVFVPTMYWSMGVPGSAIPTDQIEKDAAKVAQDLLSKASKFAEGRGVVDPKEELVTDLVSPAQGILQLAERDSADVIVVGTRGNGGFKKLLLGSVANSILHYADCSVLIVK